MRRVDPERAGWRVLPLLLLLLAWFAVTAGLRPLAAPDEGRYAGVALQMIGSGDWLVPRLDGLPFFHKPPLFYWIGAAAMSVFGPVEWAARLPSIVGATLAGFSLWLFLRRHASAIAARKAATVLATMPFFYVGAQFANLDMLVAGCISATILCTAHAALLMEEGSSAGKAVLGAFALAGLGLLAKGLIGLVLPAAVVLIWALACRRPRRALVLLRPSGWLVLALIGLPWMAAMQWRFPAFFDYFIVTQHFRRFAQTGFNNAHPFWFYLPVVLCLTLPWSARWLVGLRNLRARVGPWTEIDTLMLTWLAVVLVFFSLPQSKLVGYVLPALPPMAWFAAPFVRRWLVILAAVVCVVAVVLAGRFAVPPATRLALPPGFAPGDRVVMVDDFFYELPFYWQLRQPVFIASDWSPEVAASRDNWRKEVFDAATFATPDQRRVLIAPGDIAALSDKPGTTWLVGQTENSTVVALSHGAPPVERSGPIGVWRFTR